MSNINFQRINNIVKTLYIKYRCPVDSKIKWQFKFYNIDDCKRHSENFIFESALGVRKISFYANKEEMTLFTNNGIYRDIKFYYKDGDTTLFTIDTCINSTSLNYDDTITEKDIDLALLEIEQEISKIDIKEENMTYTKVKCAECYSELQILFRRKDNKLVASCTNCNYELPIESKDLELDFYRQEFKENNLLA